MASFRGINAVLEEMQRYLESRLPTFDLELPGGPGGGGASAPPSIIILGSRNFAQNIQGNMLGLYLHRLTIDPHGRTRYASPTAVPAGAPATGSAQEIPVNMHFLLVASGSPAMEAALLSWALVQLTNLTFMDTSHFSQADPQWRPNEILTITPEEMTTEDLMRIWDTLDAPYTNSLPFIARTVRLAAEAAAAHGPVMNRVFSVGDMGADSGAG